MEDEPRQPTLDASPRGKTTGIHRLANDRLDGAGGFIWNDDVHIYIYKDVYAIQYTHRVNILYI